MDNKTDFENENPEISATYNNRTLDNYFLIHEQNVSEYSKKLSQFC